MPMIAVAFSSPGAGPGRDEVQAIAEGLSEITARVLRKDPVLIAVAVSSIAAEHWFVGAASLAAQGKSAFWLDIAVTDGTNSKDEKAQYLAEVFAFMARHLAAPLHETSYVLIHDAAADSYGYGGLSQEQRYVSGKLAHDRAAA